MKIIIAFTTLLLIIASCIADAAAPDDISSNQRAWFDAVDINGNSNYTDNPLDNSDISQWTDKSGLANHVTASGTTMPIYRYNSIATERHGVDFDGNDRLTDSTDIWTGSVSQSEIFVVATTDLVKTSAIFNSYGGDNQRLGVHLPWSNSQTYFDQGPCCGTPTRLQGNISIALSQHYFWHFVGLPADQSVIQDGKISLSDSGAGTYTSVTTPVFYLGATGSFGHNGRIFESIFYQTELNIAQRKIINSYLSAKWDKAFNASPNYGDAYVGDDSANGDYDFFVGGIGQDSGLQSTGTSQGLSITNNSFLTADGKFVLAGVDYLTATPTTGTSTLDLPLSYKSRSNRTWYIDTTGTGGLVNLQFNATTIGISVENGEIYGLLHRTGVSGDFTEVATATMSGGLVTFSHLPDDGVYSVAKREKVIIGFKKTSMVASDPINGTTNPKSIPGSLVDYTLAVNNSGEGSADSNSINISDTLSGNLVLFTGDLDGSGNPFIFTDNSCPPATNTLNSTLSITYPSAIIYKNSSGTAITPASDFDSTIRSFTIDMSGIFQASDGTNTPCFTITYRTRLE